MDFPVFCPSMHVAGAKYGAQAHGAQLLVGRWYAHRARIAGRKARRSGKFERRAGAAGSRLRNWLLVTGPRLRALRARPQLPRSQSISNVRRQPFFGGGD
jgi:hypothetical protein